MKNDPLLHFYRIYGYDHKKIQQLVAGKKYCAMELTDGNCGVCGQNNTGALPEVVRSIDLDNEAHRILYTCYLNALVNNKYSNLTSSSFVESIKPGQFNRVVMIGLFRPLYKRYKALGLNPVVFDKGKNDVFLTPMEKQPYWVQKADLIIMSATTVPNQSFEEIIKHANSSATVALTGPSAILHDDMLKYIPNGIISGMIFPAHCDELFRIIQNGEGTRSFKHLGKKVDIS